MDRRKILAPYPQNFIIRKPLYGALILFTFLFVFILLYKPLNVRESRLFSFPVTMILYSLACAVTVYITIRILTSFRFFSEYRTWSFLKEILAIYIVLQLMGVGLYFAGFFVEYPYEGSRWNLGTFISSCMYAFLIGILPFAFFTAINLRFLSGHVLTLRNESFSNEKHEADRVVKITSSLVKESLSFRSDELLFATSAGNYVVFYLHRDEKTRKVPIRNSISNIEKQLKDIPYYFRCHRAYIVNLYRVLAKRGNTLGYRLNMSGTSHIVPVSRAKVEEYNMCMSSVTGS